jgi:putative tryptophan/tyrosine transport system substrate-binding protein
MRRREFIAAIGSAFGLPRSLRAQTGPRVIGFINSASAGPLRHLVASFRKGLAEEGFFEGRDYLIDPRWAEGQYERVPTFFQEFVDKQVAAIALTGGAMHTIDPAKAKVPVVFVMGDDPVRMGLVASLNQPGGNITGITQLTVELGAKRLGLLHELLPGMKKVALLLNPSFPPSAQHLSEIEGASALMGLQPLTLRATTEADFDPVFKMLQEERPDGLLVGADPFFNSRREQIVGRVAQLGIPALYEFREFAEAGGLISYGTDLADSYRLVGVYVGRVLKGARPGNLPVMQAAKFELIVNLKVAKALGLTIPPTLLARADEVIE